MKLIPFEETIGDKSEILKNTQILETNPVSIKASQIENDLENLLSTNIDEGKKFEMFVQLFRKFLTFKNKLGDNQNDKQNNRLNQTVSNSPGFVPMPVPNNFTPLNFSIPNTSSSNSKYSTPFSSKSSAKTTPSQSTHQNRKRRRKSSAKKKIKKILNSNDSFESEQDSGETWIPFQTPKRIKTLRRERTGKK